MNIADIRATYPQYKDLSDDQLIDALHEKFYADMPRDEVAKAMGALKTSRSVMAVANDTVIEAANAAAGGIGAIADFVSPGNKFSKSVDEFVREGESKQSDVTKADKARFAADLKASQGIGDDLAAVGRHIASSPLQVAAQAAGSFAGPGLAIGAARGAAGVAGASAKVASRLGLGVGAATSAAMGGGDAAGSAYEQVQRISDDVLMQTPEVREMAQSGMSMEAIKHEIGTAAARQASVLPAIAGGVAGMVGADKILATGKIGQAGLKGVLATGAVEGLTEAAEEGLTQYEGQRAAAKYDPSIDPTKNVAAMAALGGATGFGMGAGIHAASGAQVQPKATIADIGAATTAPDAIEAFIKSVNATDDVNSKAPQTDIQPPPAAPVEAAPTVLRERDFVPPASGNFGSVNELADLVKMERADVETRRAGLLDADLAAKTAEVDAQIAFNREQQSKQNRMGVLDSVIGSEAALTMQPEQLAQAFSDALTAQGYANAVPTAQETARIMRGTMARDAMLEQEQPIIEPSQPNEMPVDLVPERAPKQIATDPLGRVKQLVSNGYKLEGKQLQGPSGERVNLSRAELLFVQSQRKGLSNDRNAAADAVSNRDVGSGRTEPADTVLRSAETGSAADAQLDQSEEARTQEPATAVPANVPGADVSVDRQPALDARAQKRADTLAALESKAGRELRNQSAKEKRQYVKTAIADILQTRDAATRQKKSAAQRKVYAKSNRIDPDRDGMAKAIAKLGGVNPAGRFRLAPEELAIRGHGVQRVFHAKGRTPDEIGSALAELGYVQTDENGKYDQQDFEDKLTSVASGEEILTPQGMMIRAEEERARAMEETGAQSAEDYDAIESYLDDASDEVQAFIDAAFDAPISQESLTDEELDRWFGAEAERETASTGISESDTGRQAVSRDQGNQAPAETGTRDEVDFALQSESRDEANARMESELAAQKQEIAELRQQMEQDRAEREQKEIDARQQASADNFRLGQSADDAITGQDDMFGNVDFASDTITIDGVERSRLNSEGKTIAYTSAGLRAFWEFYGDGPLDEDGRPVVLDGKYVNEMGVEKSVDNIGTYRRDDPRLNYAKGNDTKPQTFDHELVADIRAGASVDEVLAKIEANSQREEYRQLAAHLRTLGLKTKLEATGKRANMRFTVDGINADQFAAGYSAAKDTAYLFQTAQAETNILHELVHSASIKALAGGGKSATQMKLLYQFAKNRAELKGEYGMSNVEEFVAEAFTNPDFREALGKIKAPQSDKTLWDKFVELVKSLIGRPDISTSMLDEVLQAGYAVMADNQTADESTSDAMRGNIKAPKMPDWLKAMPKDAQEAARKAGIWQEPKPLKQRLKELRDQAVISMQQGIFDQFAPLKELGEKEYVLARLSKSADAPLEAVLMYGKPFLNDAGAVDVRTEKGGLIGALQQLQGEHDRFFAWIAGNRAAKLKTEGRENLFTDTDISALKDLNKGAMPDGSNRAVLYEKMRMTLNGYGKSVLDIAEKAGIINGPDRKIWESDFYVPFYRVMADDGFAGPKNVSGMVNQYAFKKLKGGTDNLNDLMQNTLQNWGHLLSASLKNQAAKAALTTAEKAGIAIEAPEATVRQMGKSIGTKAVSMLDNGVQRWFIVDDPFIMDAITSLEFAGWNNPAMKAMTKAKHYLTLGVTVSPTFKIRNLIRDQIAALAQNPVSYNMGRNLVEGWRGTNKDSQQYAKMLTGGGLMRFGSFLEDDRAAHAKRLIDAGVKSGTILDTSAKAKAALKGAWDWWQDVGDRSENITRAAIYKQRYEQIKADGKTDDEAHLMASFAARDSMDFSLQGKWGSIRFLTQLVPFLNARLQGLYKLGREGILPTGRMLAPQLFGNQQATDKQKAMRFGAVTGAVALASIALYLAYRDDDEYKEREDWDKDAFWWFRVGDTAYRIPKPFEIGAIGTIAERGVELAMSDMGKEDRKLFLERLGAMVTQTFSMNPVPQLFKPMIDLYANKDSFSGRPIETPGLEKLSKSERIGQNTSATAQLIGKASGKVGLSPVQVDFLVNGYFSWLGSHAVMTADFAVRPMMGLPDKPTRRFPDEYFVLGDFAKDLPSNQSKYVSKFYEQAKEVQEAMADIRYYQSMGNLEKAMELRAENADKIKLHDMYQAAERQIGDINKRIKMVQAKNIDPDQKREQIDRLNQQRNKLARRIEERRLSRQSAN